MDERRMANTKMIFDLLIAVIVVLFVITSYRYVQGAGTFAQAIGYPVLALAILTLVFDGIKLISHAHHRGKFHIDFPFVPLVLSAIYVVLMLVIGFELTTVVFLTCVPALLARKVRNIPIFLVVGLIITFLFVFLFRLGSGVVLPAGILGRLF